MIGRKNPPLEFPPIHADAPLTFDILAQAYLEDYVLQRSKPEDPVDRPRPLEDDVCLSRSRTAVSTSGSHRPNPPCTPARSTARPARSGERQRPARGPARGRWSAGHNTGTSGVHRSSASQARRVSRKKF